MTASNAYGYLQLSLDQQVLHDEVVEFVSEHRSDYAAALAEYARAGADPLDVEAVRRVLFGLWRPTSGDAVTSLVLGLVAVVCPIPFLGLAAARYGHRALNVIRPGIKSGHGMAVAGVVLGWAITTICWR